MGPLNNAQRSIAVGAAAAVLLAQLMTVEQAGAERAAWTLAILVMALLLIVACAERAEEPLAATLPTEPERRSIGFVQPA